MTLLWRWLDADEHVLRRRVLGLVMILLLAFMIRGLTMRFMREHLSDPGWFQSGSYAIFDRQAQNILDGKAPIFWISDPSQTEAAIYPPGYPLWLTVVYAVTGDRTAYATQKVQWILDSLAVLLVVGIGVTAYSWSIGLAAGFLAALSPLLALNGATPSADSPTAWIVAGGVWMLLLAAKKLSLGWAVGAGLMVGGSCWLRANGLLLVIFWAVALFLFTRTDFRKRLVLSLALTLSAFLLIAPIVIRNAFVFGAFVPTGLGMGANLWEGIGETERGPEFGAVIGDQLLIEQERKEMGLPPGAPLGLYSPNGVERDRARTRKALSVIAQHPIWYSGVMMKRMWGMLKYAGGPIPYYGSMGINVTPAKTLPLSWNSGVVAAVVTVLGGIQSVFRYLLLPLVVAGAWLALRLDRRVTWLLFATVLYYLVVGSSLHMEIRYGLAMQYLLLVFAGMSVWFAGKKVLGRQRLTTI